MWMARADVVYLQDVNADGYLDIFDRRNALPPEEGYPLHTAVAIWLNDRCVFPTGPKVFLYTLIKTGSSTSTFPPLQV